MKNIGIKSAMLFCLMGVYRIAFTQEKGYKMQPASIQTRWAKEVSPANALKEYPRPQLVRKNWTNLNGLWSYAITQKDAAKPAYFSGEILVPYPIESALSGVKKALMPGQNLWYKREIKYSPKSGMRTILNFGAVDYQCWIYVNGKEVGGHEGGYTAFSIDITEDLKPGQNEFTVKVFDPSDAGIGPRGKQVLNPKDIYYTPSSGIWQTVWLEEVPEKHISGLEITPDIDASMVMVKVNAKSDENVSILVDGKSISARSNQLIKIPIKNTKLWSPASPYLYDMEVRMGSDMVKSYFGMRKISIAKDAKGIERIMLNNKPYYNLGTLDQGFWPDGLYTAPTDEALAFDIKAIKAMGFNTIRKHIKIEPARWYYHADKLGMLVWQDFVQPDFGLNPGSREMFEKQGAEMLAQLHNSPAIVTWVLFNEKWGQYDQARLSSWVKSVDPSRLLNGHSGEYLYVNDKLRSPSPDAYVNSDITDVHSYPDPRNSIKMAGKAQVCGEFGGIGVFIPDHQWLSGSAWGYVQEKPAALLAKYAGMNVSLLKMKDEGLSGSIYTQPFDVEGEQNGLMTYDREVVKVPFAELRKIHGTLNPSLSYPGWMNGLGEVKAVDADLTDPQVLVARYLKDFEAGKRDKKTMQWIVRGVNSTSDEGFGWMVKDQEAFRAAMGSQAFSALMTGLIFKEHIQPMFAQQKSWEEIGDALTQRFGPIGEETYLRIKSLGSLNEKNWEMYKPVAKLYLEKFGKNLNEQEKEIFEKAIAEH